MEEARTFLESSTIHGISYIPKTRKYVRLFWIFTVIFGFLAASFLIYRSFQSWAKSPFKTTAETLPISELKFPKIIVCPPENTFTDMNYDIMYLDNMNITHEVRDEMLRETLEIIEEDNGMASLNLLHENNRFHNWYLGNTWVETPLQTVYNKKVYYNIGTKAANGTITSKYYGEDFNPNLVEKNIEYSVTISAPYSARKNEEGFFNDLTVKIKCNNF